MIPADMNAATKVWELQHGAFVASQQDTQESINQVGSTTDELKAQRYDIAQGASALMQLKKLRILDANLKAMADTFLEHDQSPKNVDAENLALRNPRRTPLNPSRAGSATSSRRSGKSRSSPAARPVSSWRVNTTRSSRAGA